MTFKCHWSLRIISFVLCIISFVLCDVSLLPVVGIKAVFERKDPPNFPIVIGRHGQKHDLEPPTFVSYNHLRGSCFQSVS